jgi:DME family drug/metabolite transporter
MFSQKTSTRDFLLIACASISWGTVGIANQAIYAHSATNALSLAFLRLAIAAPLFVLAGLRLLRLPGRRRFQIKRRDLSLMLLMGGLQALYQASYSAAIPYAGVTVSTLIALCAAPVIVALFSAFIARERLTLAILIALVGALGGTILLVAARAHPSAGNISLPGVALAFLSACGYAGFILCGRRLTGDYHPLHVNAVAFGTGALLLFFFAASTKLVIVYPLWGWFLLLYLGCVPTALAYGLFQVGMRSLSATVISIVTLLEPLTAAVLAWIFFQEQLNALGLLGAGLLLGSMVMILLAPKKLLTN